MNLVAYVDRETIPDKHIFVQYDTSRVLYNKYFVIYCISATCKYEVINRLIIDITWKAGTVVYVFLSMYS